MKGYFLIYVATQSLFIAINVMGALTPPWDFASRFATSVAVFIFCLTFFTIIGDRKERP